MYRKGFFPHNLSYLHSLLKMASALNYIINWEHGKVRLNKKNHNYFDFGIWIKTESP